MKAYLGGKKYQVGIHPLKRKTKQLTATVHSFILGLLLLYVIT